MAALFMEINSNNNRPNMNSNNNRLSKGNTHRIRSNNPFMAISSSKVSYNKVSRSKDGSNRTTAGRAEGATP